MAIGRCPTSGEACNFVDAFQGEDYVAPDYTQLCATPEEIETKDLLRICGFYKQLSRQMLEVAAKAKEGEI